MKLFSLLAIALVSSILFSSCQQEIDYTNGNPGTNNNHGLPSDSAYLKRYFVLDTSQTSGMDTLRFFDLSYDSQKRLNGYVYTEYNPGVGGPGRLSLTRTFFYAYNGSDTLPFRVIEELNDIMDPTNNGRDTAYYFYTNGTVIRDSTGSSSDYVTHRMDKLSPTRTRMIVTSFFVTMTRDTNYSYTNWLNGNLVQEIDSIWVPIANDYTVSTANMLFDGKPNPFKRLVLPYPVPYIPDYITSPLEDEAGPTMNNIILFNQAMDIYNTSYLYRADGMPVVSRNDHEHKGFYQYTRL